MNREDIIKLAREIGIWPFIRPQRHEEMADMLERLAALIAAAEREACAKVCDVYAANDPKNFADICAAAIRARGNT